ncbi:TPA: TcfC E-set like domain-containing protein [Aeromonas hydrophila]|uniref:TcfC E-set like domain-containing protein n=1 Tax=Aeromonas TaxID=642 RepID=UPI0009C08198|nr:TcfC E-set like domain-containing protein [Aeromonas caviae]HDZ8915790.1 TcfC E-set like domain-containing protein [Aeromonas hydrophila]
MRSITALTFAAMMIVPCYEVSADNNMPEEFSELFEFKERPVSLKDINSAEKTTVILSVNYDTVRLPKDSGKTIEVLQGYFKRNNVPQPLSDKILASLARGVKNTDGCQGYINQCVVTPENYDFYYDYDNASLLLFVNGAELSTLSSEVEYASAYNQNAALVNHFDFYTSAYSDSSSSYAINNKTLKGLQYGHLTSDFTVSDSLRKLYELSYDVSFYDNKRIYVGTFENGLSFNSTDIVSPTKFVKQKSLSFGSTNNLIVRDQKSYEQLFFFAPAPGEIRIVRDGRTIKQFAVSEGQGAISYSQLPTGRYDIDVEVIVAGKVISTDKKTIFNDITNAPNIGEGDFIITSGQLNEARDYFSSDIDGTTYQSGRSSRFDDTAFVSSAYSMRFSDSWLAAIGGLVADGDLMATLGSQWYLPSGGSVNGAVSFYQPGSVAYDAQFTTGNFSVQYEQLKHKDGGDSLAAYLMGKYDYHKLSGNVFHSFRHDITGYYNYSYGKYIQIGSVLPDIEQSNSTLGLGYNLPWNNIRVDFTLDYDHVASNRSAYVNIQIPFGDEWSAKSSVNNNSIGGSEYKASVVKDNLIGRKNMSSSLELSSGYSNLNGDVVNEMYGNINTREKTFQGGLNLYANNNGSQGVSGSFSSNQVISSNGIDFTSQRSDVYAIINADVDKVHDVNDDPYGFVTLRNNEKLENKSFIYDSHQTIPISTYGSYSINVDTESVSLYNSGQQGFDGFTYPGSAILIQPKLKQLVTFVSAFSNVLDVPVGDVLCKGFGCVDVAKVMDGVFRITVVEGSDFSLFTGLDRCLVPNDQEDAELMNFGSNYCLPDAEPRSIVNVVDNQSNKPYKLYYAGTFDNSNLVNESVDKLISMNSKVYKRKIGSNIALYLLIDERSAIALSSAQQILVDSMQLYARENKIMNVISQPVVMRKGTDGVLRDD